MTKIRTTKDSESHRLERVIATKMHIHAKKKKTALGNKIKTNKNVDNKVKRTFLEYRIKCQRQKWQRNHKIIRRSVQRVQHSVRIPEKAQGKTKREEELFEKHKKIFSE